jgi:hypothetical protein
VSDESEALTIINQTLTGAEANWYSVFQAAFPYNWGPVLSSAVAGIGGAIQNLAANGDPWKGGHPDHYLLSLNTGQNIATTLGNDVCAAIRSLGMGPGSENPAPLYDIAESGRRVAFAIDGLGYTISTYGLLPPELVTRVNYLLDLLSAMLGQDRIRAIVDMGDGWATLGIDRLATAAESLADTLKPLKPLIAALGPALGPVLTQYVGFLAKYGTPVATKGSV